MKSRDVLVCSKTDTMPRYLDLLTRAAEEEVLPRIVLLFNKFEFVFLCEEIDDYRITSNKKKHFTSKNTNS